MIAERDAAQVGDGGHTESLLREMGLAYQRIRIRVDAIDWERSSRTQYRIGHRVDEDQVLLYAEAMGHGDVFPPIVVCSLGGGRRLICPAGVTRLGAARLLELPDIDAFLVEGATQAEIDRIGKTDNLRHGRPISLEDRLWLALHDLQTNPISVRTAARLYGVPEGRLMSFRRRRAAADRLLSMGLPEITSADALERVSGIRSDPVFRAVGSLPDRRASVIDPLVRELNRAKSEGEQLAIVQSAREAQELDRHARASLPSAHGKGNATVYARLTRLANSSGGWPSPEQAAREVDPKLQPVIRKRLVASLGRIEAIVEALKP